MKQQEETETEREHPRQEGEGTTHVIEEEACQVDLEGGGGYKGIQGRGSWQEPEQ